MSRIRVTRTFPDGSTLRWTQNGQDQPGRVARLRAAGTPHQAGPGWVEFQCFVGAVRITERVEWLDR